MYQQVKRHLVGGGTGSVESRSRSSFPSLLPSGGGLRVAAWLSLGMGPCPRGKEEGGIAGQLASHGESVLLDLGRKARPRDFHCISLGTKATLSCKRVRKWTIRLASLRVRERRNGVRLGAG